MSQSAMCIGRIMMMFKPLSWLSCCQSIWALCLDGQPFFRLKRHKKSTVQDKDLSVLRDFVQPSKTNLYCAFFQLPLQSAKLQAPA